MTDHLQRDCNYVPGGSGKEVGSLLDPSTGETVSVVAVEDRPSIPYRKSSGRRGDAITPEAVADWPNGGLWSIYFSNGRLFEEVYTDANGWWRSVNARYVRGRRYHWLSNFFIQLGAGLSNGYPLKDILGFATGWSLRSLRGEWRA